MSEIPIIAKVIISLVFLWMFAISVYLGWCVLGLTKRVKQLQDDRNELIEERAKQSNSLRLKGIEMDEENRKKFILSELEKKMILNALKMPGYKVAIDEPSTHHHVRKTYRELKEKIRESLKERKAINHHQKRVGDQISRPLHHQELSSASTKRQSHSTRKATPESTASIVGKN